MRSTAVRGLPTAAASTATATRMTTTASTTTAAASIRIVAVTGLIARGIWRADDFRIPRGIGSASDLMNRPLKTPERLAQGFNFAFVGRLLPFRFLDQLEQFIQRLDGIAQAAEHGLSFLDGLTDGGRFSGLKGWRIMWGHRANVALLRGALLATFLATRRFRGRIKRLGGRFM